MAKRRRAMKRSPGAGSVRRHARLRPRGRPAAASKRELPLFMLFVARETPTAQKIEIIRAGVGARVVDDMVAYLDVPKAVIFALLHTPESTAHKLIKDNRNLDAAASERVVRVGHLRRARGGHALAEECQSGAGRRYASLDAGHGAGRGRGPETAPRDRRRWRVVVAGTVVWRIARRPFALDRLGLGARDGGGRWNHVGTAVIYAGGSIAIAALEKFVQLAGITPPDLVLVRLELPARHSAETPNLVELPRGWDLVPATPASMDFGTAWARELRSLVLHVPSVLVPEERNAVINPAHREFATVEMAIEREFRYDDRMLGGRRP
jgi:RES domain-containing protein